VDDRQITVVLPPAPVASVVQPAERLSTVVESLASAEVRVIDQVGSIVHVLQPAEKVSTLLLQQGPAGPPGSGEAQSLGKTLTYSSGVLTRIDFDNGDYKLFTYVAGRISRIDWHRGSVVVRSEFQYDGDLVSQIVVTEL
jgi:hypothetical protein